MLRLLAERNFPVDELRVFADEHDLCLISIADLIAYRKRFDKLVERVAEASVP